MSLKLLESEKYWEGESVLYILKPTKQSRNTFHLLSVAMRKFVKPFVRLVYQLPPRTQLTQECLSKNIQVLNIKSEADCYLTFENDRLPSKIRVI